MISTLFVKGVALLFISSLCFAELNTGSDTTEPEHISLGTWQVQKISIGTSPTLIWEVTNPPTITFSVSPNTIDLDTIDVNTKLTFTFTVSGVTGQTTTAQIYKLPENTAIGATFTAGSGLNISNTLPNIDLPTHTTSYRIVGMNPGGASNKDVTVTVTEDAGIENLRRTLFIDSHSGVGYGNYQFKATVFGTPRPVISFRLPDGQSFSNNAHIAFRSTGVNTWEITIGGPAGIRISQNFGTIAVTATNSTNTVTIGRAINR